MSYPTYQDLAEALQVPEFITALIGTTLPKEGIDDPMVPWSIMHIPYLMSKLEPIVDHEQHAVITILGSHVSTLAQVDESYVASLKRNRNIKAGIGAYTLFGTHVLTLSQAPGDRITVVSVALDDEGKMQVIASVTSRVACRVAALIPQESLVLIIAQQAHELNRQYCISQGDDSQPEWKDAPDWQRDSAITGVRMHLANPEATPADSHQSWMAQKEADGWVYGDIKDPEAKTHPCMVPYDELPPSQRAKDYLFRSTVHQIAALLKPLSF